MNYRLKAKVKWWRHRSNMLAFGEWLQAEGAICLKKHCAASQSFFLRPALHQSFTLYFPALFWWWVQGGKTIWCVFDHSPPVCTAEKWSLFSFFYGSINMCFHSQIFVHSVYFHCSLSVIQCNVSLVVGAVQNVFPFHGHKSTGLLPYKKHKSCTEVGGGDGHGEGSKVS